MKLTLILTEIKDHYVRDNFKRLQAYLTPNSLSKGNFTFFSKTFNGAVTKQKVLHGLSFQPLDVLQLSVTKNDASAITWHYDSFDATNLVISTTGACTVRAYIGKYSEDNQ